MMAYKLRIVLYTRGMWASGPRRVVIISAAVDIYTKLANIVIPCGCANMNCSRFFHVILD